MQNHLSLNVNPNIGTPVFKQLVDQVQRLIARGKLAPGDRLPSTRDVAKQLTINPMTVSKAYSQLELAGHVERKKGIGMIVRESKLDPQQHQEALLNPALNEFIMQAKQLGLSQNEACKLVNDTWSEHE